MEMRRRFILFNVDKGRNGGREDKFPSTPFMASIENVMHWMVTLYSHKNAQTHNDNRWISKQLFSQNYTIFNEKWIWIRMMLLIRLVCVVYFHLPRLFGSFKKKKRKYPLLWWLVDKVPARFLSFILCVCADVLWTLMHVLMSTVYIMEYSGCDMCDGCGNYNVSIIAAI